MGIKNRFRKNPYVMNSSYVITDHTDYENNKVAGLELQETFEADLNHAKDGSTNNEPDRIEVYTGEPDGRERGMVLIYSGYPANEAFSIEAHTDTRGDWTRIYLVHEDERDYVFQLYIDAEYGTCSYYVYGFEEQLGPALSVYLLNGAVFSYHGEMSRDSYKKWAEQMNSYLKDAVLILSTQDGELRVGPSNDFDRYQAEVLWEVLTEEK